MTPITRSSRQSLAGVRGAVLDAAADMLAQRGLGGLHMADVAARAGVSRQTVYNEFGSKQGLVQAATLHTTAEFLDGVAQRLAAARTVLDGVRSATVFAIEHAAENPMIASMLDGRRAEDLLPFVTTRGEPVLHACADVGAAFVSDRVPDLPPELAEQLGDGIARLIISHVLLCRDTPEQAADAVLALIGPALAGYTELPRPDHR